MSKQKRKEIIRILRIRWILINDTSFLEKISDKELERIFRQSSTFYGLIS